MWSWEEHGEGWALYEGRSDTEHGLNRISASNRDAFDHQGALIRARIAELLNRHGIVDAALAPEAGSAALPDKALPLTESEREWARGVAARVPEAGSVKADETRCECDRVAMCGGTCKACADQPAERPGDERRELLRLMEQYASPGYGYEHVKAHEEAILAIFDQLRERAEAAMSSLESVMSQHGEQFRRAEAAEKRVAELASDVADSEARRKGLYKAHNAAFERIAELERQLATSNGAVLHKDALYRDAVAERDQLRAQLAKREEGERRVRWVVEREIEPGVWEEDYQEDSEDALRAEVAWYEQYYPKMKPRRGVRVDEVRTILPAAVSGGSKG